MGTTADNIVQITITRETRPVAIANFGIILIVGPNSTTGNRLDYYSSIDTVAANLTGGTSAPEYKAAAAIFSQNPRVSLIAIGKKEVGDANYLEALTAIKLYENNWYGVIGATRTVSEQEEIANWIALDGKRVGAFASAGTDIGGGVIDIVDQAQGTDATSIAHHIQSQSIDRCAVIYHNDPDTYWADAAFLGRILPLTPGSYTGAFKTLTGITATELTTTQVTNLHAKKASSYETIGGVDVVFEGWVGTGEYIDIIIFQDWLEAKIIEIIYGLLVNSLKVPYTDGGITTIENGLKQALKIGQDNGGISPTTFDAVTKTQTGGYVTEVPAAADVPANDKNTRTLNNVKFTAWLAGAIHKVVVSGILTV